MSTHAAHLNDELLSAYLDGELPARQADRVEDHLEHCPGCRTRLSGLRRVVGTLARLEAAAPPPALARRVERRVTLVERQTGLFERLERDLKGLRLDSPMVVTFAVILALAVIVYVFSHGLARHSGGGDVSFHVAPPEAAEGLMEGAATVQIDGRRLVRDGETWRQEGVEGESVRPVDWDSREGRALRRDHPWIEELLSLTGTGTVVFEAGDAGVVRLSRNEAPLPQPPTPDAPGEP